MKTAFVASTLPALYLRDHWKSTGIERVVCASSELAQSFEFLSAEGTGPVLVSLSADKNSRRIEIDREIKNALAGVVVFHECCWNELDIAILELQPTVYFFPCVTLDSWRKIPPAEMTLGRVFLKVIRERSRNALSFVRMFLQYGNSFDFYELDLDSGTDAKGYAIALKTTVIRKLIKGDGCLNCRIKGCSPPPSRPQERYGAVLLVTATDVVSDEWQRKVFEEIADRCAKKGLRVYVKDHPNPTARLRVVSDSVPLSPFVPLEVLKESYDFKIGLFSTALVHEPNRSISIANLFRPAPNGFESRRRHLDAFPGSEGIHYPGSLDELMSILG